MESDGIPIKNVHPIIHPTWAYPTTNAILHWKKGRGLRAGEGTPMGWEICLWTCVDPAVHQPMGLGKYRRKIS